MAWRSGCDLQNCCCKMPLTAVTNQKLMTHGTGFAEVSEVVWALTKYFGFEFHFEAQYFEFERATKYFDFQRDMALLFVAVAAFFRIAAGWLFLASPADLSWLGRQTSVGGVPVQLQIILLLLRGSSLGRRLNCFRHFAVSVVALAFSVVVVVDCYFLICLMWSNVECLNCFVDHNLDLIVVAVGYFVICLMLDNGEH